MNILRYGRTSWPRKSREATNVCSWRSCAKRAYADGTNRLLLEEYKRLQVQLQMSMVGAAGEMPSEDMQRFQQLASLLYMNSDVQAYLMAEMQMQKTLADIFKILTEAAGIRFDVPDKQ
ncbi:MAG: YlbF family regulator [Christensenellales bacterium]